jgi:leucyl/phenylalanyl-tRNA--protein transferase
MIDVTPDLVIRAYASGVFPMADSRSAQDLLWFDPPMRGIIPLEGFHVPRRLTRTVRRWTGRVTVDRAFEDVIRSCAAPRPGHPETWINGEIIALYSSLHQMGVAHSIEAWRDNELVGGLYGISLGGAFFGESMFSRETDASKIALVALVARLRRGGFTLLDTQFLTSHLARFGAIEISRDAYHRLLADALGRNGNFYCLPGESVGAEIMQSMTQTS